jgi:hypothetical protein
MVKRDKGTVEQRSLITTEHEVKLDINLITVEWSNVITVQRSLITAGQSSLKSLPITAACIEKQVFKLRI